MAKIQINDVELNGAELFNDSETFLNELQDSETQKVVGGMRVKQPFYDEHYRFKPYRTTVYIPREPIHPKKPSHSKEPVHPIEIPFEPVIL